MYKNEKFLLEGYSREAVTKALFTYKRCVWQRCYHMDDITDDKTFGVILCGSTETTRKTWWIASD